MKLSIERAVLLKSLAHVQSVVERRNTIPILSNVLLEAAKDHLNLTATDMDLAIVEATSAQINQPGAVSAPAHMLYDIVRKLPEGSEVHLETQAEQGQLILKAGRSRFALPTLPRDDFPAVAAGDLPNKFTLPAKSLRLLIDRTGFAVSTEETRYYLNGIFLHALTGTEQPLLRGVATDGHRLARVELPLPDGAADMPGVIVPRKTVTELRKLLDEGDAEIEIALSDTRIRFAFGTIAMTSKLIDGTFPDYQRVIPTSNDKVLEVDRRSFAEAVDRVSTISSERSRAVKMAAKPKTLSLSATSAENGSANEELEVDYDGVALEIGFNARYLLDITRQIEGDKVWFAMADAGSPIVMRDAGDESALYILMPMRV